MTEPLPHTHLGPHRISRLIAGANTINGGSHLTRFINAHMRRYFTAERVLAFLSDCERAGINTWQSGAVNLDLYAQHRRMGGQLQYISLAADSPDDPDLIKRIAESGAIAIAHHGEATDRLFKAGELGSIRPFLARVRDAGLQVGVSTHMPAVVEAVESSGWDVDFYMTCVYERHRTREELISLLGHVPVPLREVYLEDDPPRMFRAMQQTPKPCLAFKILAAGRLCDRQETVEQAFRDTFSQIKPSDAVIVGMYPEFEDQVALNTGYTCRFSELSRRVQ